MNQPWSVPRCWAGETVAIFGGGESLAREAVRQCQDKVRVIAINRAYQLAPWADWLWGGDPRFWSWYADALDFSGIKIVTRAATPKPAEYWARLRALESSGVRVIFHSSRSHPAEVIRHEGCSDDPSVVNGNNSCCGILSIIAHTGASRLLLLGIDCVGGHWHEGYPQGVGRPDYGIISPTYVSFARDLDARGVTVINCSPLSAHVLPFEHRRLEDAL